MTVHTLLTSKFDIFVFVWVLVFVQVFIVSKLANRWSNRSDDKVATTLILTVCNIALTVTAIAVNAIHFLNNR